MKTSQILILCLLFVSTIHANIPQPIIYLSFDDSWANSGSEGFGELPTVVTSGGNTPAYGNGLKGKCFDITTASGNYTNSGCLYYGVDGATNTDIETALYGLKSFTITWWVNAANQLSDGEPFYLAHYFDMSPGGKLEAFCNSTGAPRFRMDSNTWLAVPINGDGEPDANEWAFYALTYDSTVSSGNVTTHLYMANPVNDIYTLNEVSISSSYNTNNPGPIDVYGPFIIGNRYTNGLQGMDGKLDEFRLWGSDTDQSGAFTIDQIQEVMERDLGFCASHDDSIATNIKDTYFVYDSNTLFCLDFENDYNAIDASEENISPVSGTHPEIGTDWGIKYIKYVVGDTLSYTAQNHFDPEIGTLEVMLRRRKGASINKNQHIFSLYTDSDDRLYIRFTDNDEILWVYQSNGNVLKADRIDNKIKDNYKWHHLAFQWDFRTNQGTIRLYVDNKLVSAYKGDDIDQLTINGSSEIYVGVWPTASAPAIDFDIAGVKLSNKLRYTESSRIGIDEHTLFCIDFKDGLYATDYNGALIEPLDTSYYGSPSGVKYDQKKQMNYIRLKDGDKLAYPALDHFPTARGCFEAIVRRDANDAIDDFQHMFTFYNTSAEKMYLRFTPDEILMPVVTNGTPSGSSGTSVANNYDVNNTREPYWMTVAMQWEGNSDGNTLAQAYINGEKVEERYIWGCDILDVGSSSELILGSWYYGNLVAHEFDIAGVKVSDIWRYGSVTQPDEHTWFYLNFEDGLTAIDKNDVNISPDNSLTLPSVQTDPDLGLKYIHLETGEQLKYPALNNFPTAKGTFEIMLRRNDSNYIATPQHMFTLFEDSDERMYIRFNDSNEFLWLVQNNGNNKSNYISYKDPNIITRNFFSTIALQWEFTEDSNGIVQVYENGTKIDEQIFSNYSAIELSSAAELVIGGWTSTSFAATEFDIAEVAISDVWRYSEKHPRLDEHVVFELDFDDGFNAKILNEKEGSVEIIPPRNAGYSLPTIKTDEEQKIKYVTITDGNMLSYDAFEFFPTAKGTFELKVRRNLDTSVNSDQHLFSLYKNSDERMYFRFEDTDDISYVLQNGGSNKSCTFDYIDPNMAKGAFWSNIALQWQFDGNGNVLVCYYENGKKIHEGRYEDITALELDENSFLAIGSWIYGNIACDEFDIAEIKISDVWRYTDGAVSINTWIDLQEYEQLPVKINQLTQADSNYITPAEVNMLNYYKDSIEVYSNLFDDYSNINDYNVVDYWLSARSAETYYDQVYTEVKCRQWNSDNQNKSVANWTSGESKIGIFTESSMNKISSHKLEYTPSDTNSINIYSGKNEYESFNLILTSLNDSSINVSLATSDLELSDGPDIISSNDVEIYKVGLIGDQYPDPLLETDGSDLIESTKLGVYWITVYVPNDVSAGTYNSKITITQDGNSYDLYYTLEVWDFELPVKPALKTSFGFSPILCETWTDMTGKDINDVVDAYVKYMLKHHTSPKATMKFDNDTDTAIETGNNKTFFHPRQILKSDGSIQLDFNDFDNQVETYLPYGLNTFIVGNRFWDRQNQARDVFVSGGDIDDVKLLNHRLWVYDEVNEVETCLELPILSQDYNDIMESVFQQWENHLIAKGWQDMGLGYICDEPVSTMDEFVSQLYGIANAGAPNTPMLLTLEPDDNFLNVDIWCTMLHRTSEQDINDAISDGNEIWFYVCNQPHPPYGNFWLYQDPIEHRILFWQSYKYNAKGFLYWETNTWSDEDPIASLEGGEYDHQMDGMLMYPGLNGPIGSVRYEVIRDGIEDYGYHVLLKYALDNDKLQQEDEQDAGDLLAIPDVNSFTDFTRDPSVLMDRRKLIGEILDRANW